MARAFGLVGDGWRRHANPWSVHTRIPIPALIAVLVNDYLAGDNGVFVLLLTAAARSGSGGGSSAVGAANGNPATMIATLKDMAIRSLPEVTAGRNRTTQA